MELLLIVLSTLLCPLSYCDGLEQYYDLPPLYFLEHETYIIISENDSVILPCRTNSENTRNTWYRDETVIRDNISHTFRIASTHRNNTGLYRCVALNKHGGLRSTTMKLEIGYLDPPVRAPSRSLIEVPLGQAVVLWPDSYAQISTGGGANLPDSNHFNHDRSTQMLGLNAVPTPRAKWTMNNGPIPTSTSLYVSSIEQALVVLNVDREVDSSVFRAHLANSYGSANSRGGVYTQSFILTVRDPSPDSPSRSLTLVLPPKDVTIVLQDNQLGSATFECVFNARPASALRVRWYRRQVDGSGPNQMELIQSNIIGTDSKKFSSNQRVYQFDRSGLNRSMTVINISKPLESPNTGMVGNYVEEFTCQAYLDSFDTTESQFWQSEEPVHQGLAHMGGPLSATARLRIHVTPRLRLSASVTPLAESANRGGQPKAAVVHGSASSILVVPCEFEHVGHPRATVEWLKNGQKLQDESNRIHVATNNSLIIEKVKGDDAGVYQCFARNVAGEDFLAFWIKVTSFAPQLQVVEASQLNVTVLEEESVNLLCPLDAAPAPTYTWFKEQQPDHWIKLQTGEPENHLGTSQFRNRLIIQFARLNHNGLYRCEAVNHLGSEVAFVRLSVFARTHPTVNLPERLTALVNDSLQLPCVVSSHVDNQVAFDWLHRRRGQSPQYTSTINTRGSGLVSHAAFTIDSFERNATETREQGSVLVIRHMRPENAGFYVCRVVSKGGNLSMSTEIQVIPPPPRPENLIAAVYEGAPNKSFTSRASSTDVIATRILELSFKLSEELVPVTNYLLFVKQMSIETCNDINGADWNLASVTPTVLSNATGASSVRFNLSVLCPAQAYCIRLATSNSLGWSQLSQAIQLNASKTSCLLSLPQPEDFFYAITNSTINIAWNVRVANPDCLHTVPYIEYQIEYWEQNCETQIKRTLKSTGLFNQITLKQLKPSTTYAIKISVVNHACFSNEFVELLARTENAIPSKPPKTTQIKHIWSTSMEIEFFYPLDPLTSEIEAFKIRLTCIDPPGCPSRETVIPISRVNKTRLPQEHIESSIEHVFRRTRQSTKNPSETGQIYSVIVTDLAPYSLYEASVAALTVLGSSPYSQPPEVFRTKEAIPDPVTLLTVLLSEPDRLHLHWKQPDATGGPIQYYLIKYSKVIQIDGKLAISLRHRRGTTDWLSRNHNADKSINPFQKFQIPSHSSWQPSEMRSSLNTEDANFVLTTPIKSIRAKPDSRVTLDQLDRDTLYAVAVSAVSKAGTGPAGILFGRTSTSEPTEQQQLHDADYLEWQTQHIHRPNDRLLAIYFNQYVMEYVQQPIIWQVKDSHALFNISVLFKLTSENPRSSTPLRWGIERSRLTELLARWQWPIQVQQIPASGFLSDWDESTTERWHWLPAAHCERISWSSAHSESTNQLNGSAELPGIAILTLRSPKLHWYTHYRLRVWQPLYTLFSSVWNSTSGIVNRSLPSDWFSTTAGTPQRAPCNVRLTVLDEHRMRASWLPLSPSDWNGPPGGYILILERQFLTPLSRNHSDFEEISPLMHVKYQCQHDERDSCGIIRQVVCINDTISTQYTFKDLKPLTRYRFNIRAFSWNVNGNPGAQSDMLCGPGVFIDGEQSVHELDHSLNGQKTWEARPTLPVSQLSGTLERGHLVLRWSEPKAFPCGMNVTHYKIQLTHQQHERGSKSSELRTPVITHSWMFRVDDPHITSTSSASTTSSQPDTITRMLTMNVQDLTSLLRYPPSWYPCPGTDEIRLSVQFANTRGEGPVGEETTLLFASDTKPNGVISLRSITMSTFENNTIAVGRALLSWKVSVTNRNARAKTTAASLRWYQIDPVTQEPLGPPTRRLLHWPQSLNAAGAEAEFLVAIDGLVGGSSYRFVIEENAHSQSEDAVECGSEHGITAHIVPIENWITPYRQPNPPTRRITMNPIQSKTIRLAARDQHSCNQASITLAWPAYPCSLQSLDNDNQHTIPKYTAPVRNYSLQYVRLSQLSSQADARTLTELARTISSHDFSPADWIQYEPSPQVGQEIGFHVMGLTPYSVYVFRLAARTDAGMSPYSELSDLIFTSSSMPCEAPRNISVNLITVNRAFLNNMYNGEFTKGELTGSCQTILVRWTEIAESAWNAEPQSYRVTYRAWTTKPNHFDRVLFVRRTRGQNGQVYLPPLPAHTYFEVQVAAHTDFGAGPTSDKVLAFSGDGCPQELASNPWQFASQQSVDAEQNENHGLNDAVVQGFTCSSNKHTVEIKCTWIPNTDPKLIGYHIKIQSHGMVNQSAVTTTCDQSSTTHSYSVFVPSNVTRLLLFSEPYWMRRERPAQDRPDIGQVTDAFFNSRRLRPYHCYTIHIQTLLSDLTRSRWSHAPGRELPDTDTSEFAPASNSHLNSTQCPNGYLVSAQFPPTEPLTLQSQWLSRRAAQLSWSPPVLLNGRLKGYRVTVERIHQRISRTARNSTTMSTTQSPQIIHFTSSTTYQMDAMLPNATYFIEVIARTEAVQFDGFGPPACIVVTTDSCLRLSAATQRSHGAGCSLLMKRFRQLSSIEYENCVQLLPEMYRPTVRSRHPGIVHGVVVIGTTAKPTHAVPTTYAQVVEPMSVNRSENIPIGMRDNSTSSEESAPYLEISWTVGMQATFAASQFLLEVRTSRNLRGWYPIRVMHHTFRQLTLFVDDSALLQAAHDNAARDLSNVDSTVRGSSEVTRQMVAAAFAQHGIPLDSPSHVAIQFRLSPATPSQLGLPGPGSSWMIIAIEPLGLPFYRQWWFPVILAICSTLSIAILVLFLRASIRRHVYKSQFFVQKMTPRSHDLMLECCILNETCVDATSVDPGDMLPKRHITTDVGNIARIPEITYVAAMPMQTSCYPISEHPLAASMSPVGCVDGSWGSRTVSNKTSSSAEVHPQYQQLGNRGPSPTAGGTAAGYSCTFPYAFDAVGLRQPMCQSSSPNVERPTQFKIPLVQPTLSSSSHVIRSMDPTDSCPPIDEHYLHTVTCDRSVRDDPNLSFYSSTSRYPRPESRLPAGCCTDGSDTRWTNHASYLVQGVTSLVGCATSEQLLHGCDANLCQLASTHDSSVYPPNDCENFTLMPVDYKMSSNGSYYYIPHGQSPATRSVTCSQLPGYHSEGAAMERDWMANSIHSAHADRHAQLSPDLMKSVLQNGGISCNAYILDSDVAGTDAYPHGMWNNQSDHSNCSPSLPSLPTSTTTTTTTRMPSFSRMTYQPEPVNQTCDTTRLTNHPHHHHHHHIRGSPARDTLTSTEV